MKLLIETVDAAEAERITGLNRVRQRDLRRHGYLPATEGQARYDLEALAYMLALRLCIDSGIGPQAAAPAAHATARQIFWETFKWPESWTGTENVPGETWGDRWRLLRAKLEATLQTKTEDRRFLMFLADGAAVLTDSVDEQMNSRMSSHPAVGGLVRVFDIQGLSALLYENMQRPVFHLVPNDAPAPPQKGSRARRTKELA